MPVRVPPKSSVSSFSSAPYCARCSKKTYFVPSLRRNVTLTLSAKGIKVIDARGIESVVKDLLARGEKI